MCKILLSICIPTNGRLDILDRTLKSIFSQAKDFSQFEVILSDNSKTDDLKELLEKYSGIPNIVYMKSDAPGFLNSINALKMGRGELLKLHNNYSELKERSLDYLLDIVKKNEAKKPILFFSNMSLKDISIYEVSKFDSFMYSLSYFSSWSTGFSIWRVDLQNVINHELNKMFPHTSLLLTQTKKKSYIINNTNLFYNQPAPTKGGYNLFKTFCVDYLHMLDNSRALGDISAETFDHIRNQMFSSFVVPWYFATKVKKNSFTYDLSGIRSSLNVYYPWYYYYLMIMVARILYPFKGTIIKWKNLINLYLKHSYLKLKFL